MHACPHFFVLVLVAVFVVVGDGQVVGVANHGRSWNGGFFMVNPISETRDYEVALRAGLNYNCDYMLLLEDDVVASMGIVGRTVDGARR